MSFEPRIGLFKLENVQRTPVAMGNTNNHYARKD